MILEMNQIKVMDRVRKDNGDIHELAESIRLYGQMNPITVVEINGEYGQPLQGPQTVKPYNINRSESRLLPIFGLFHFIQ